MSFRQNFPSLRLGEMLAQYLNACEANLSHRSCQTASSEMESKQERRREGHSLTIRQSRKTSLLHPINSVPLRCPSLLCEVRRSGGSISHLMGDSHFNCLLWCLTRVWSDAHVASTSLPSLRAPDGDTYDEPCDFLPLLMNSYNAEPIFVFILFA